MSKSSPPPDPVHSLTSQIGRVNISSADSRATPSSLLPANGALLHAPFTQPRMEMPVPMLAASSHALAPAPIHHTSGQSLTMAYARSYSSQIPYPTSMPSPSPQFSQSLTPPQPTRSAYSFGSHAPLAPRIDTHFPVPSQLRPRASSTPASPTSPSRDVFLSSAAAASTVQCAGVTKAGKRCTRQVKAPPLVSYFTSSDNDPIERLCFQHVKEILQPTGFYSRRTGAGWVEFSDWIPKYLNADTQAALRVEMERPRSDKDEDGYIYTYEIRDDRTPDEVHLKVGRSTKLVKRLDQWSKQCTSKEVVLRGWWPGSVEVSGGGGGDTSLLKGKIKAGQKGPHSHRLERLVHLELADLSVHAPYLRPGFPKLNQDIATPDLNGASPARSTKAKTPRPNKPCLDCGTVHKEIFSFKRVKNGGLKDGDLKDGEWQKIVRPVIQRWGRFVSECL